MKRCSCWPKLCWIRVRQSSCATEPGTRQTAARLAGSLDTPLILLVRLGAMGDVIAALPVVASVKHSSPQSKITWVIEPKWKPLLDGNPYIDSVIPLDRRTWPGLKTAWSQLRSGHYDMAVD